MAKILMICHDQHLDRRVLAQAETLMAHKHDVELIALSYKGNDVEEVLDSGLSVFRIGLDKIIPENRIYQRYQKCQYWLLEKISNSLKWQRIFSGLSKLNWSYYAFSLSLYYRNKTMHDPLPFRKAFYEEGLKHQADVVQVHDLPALQAGSELAEVWGVPLVYDAHELYPEQATFSSVQKKICANNEKEFIQKANLVFAVNESIAHEMKKRYAIQKPIELLNAIDPHPSFNPQKKYNLLREKTGISEERKILLFQGGFSPNRNLSELIQAMTLLQSEDVDLVMMGFGDYGDKLKALAKSKGLLDKRVFFLEAVPQSELLQHSASADVGVIPYPHVDLNSYYCTPNKLFEFIQAGLPMLANDSPELRRFVQEMGFGLVFDMNSVQGIASAIDHVFEDKDRIYAFSETIRSKRAQLSWKAEEKKFLNAYAGVIDE